jgi:hypothetical protein
VAALIAEQAEKADVDLNTSDGSYLPFLHYEMPLPVDSHKGNPDAREPELVYALLGEQTIEPTETLVQGQRTWLVVALEHSLKYQQEIVKWFKGQTAVREEHDAGRIKGYLLAREITDVALMRRLRTLITIGHWDKGATCQTRTTPYQEDP